MREAELAALAQKHQEMADEMKLAGKMLPLLNQHDHAPLSSVGA